MQMAFAKHHDMMCESLCLSGMKLRMVPGAFAPRNAQSPIRGRLHATLGSALSIKIRTSVFPTNATKWE